MKNIITIVAIVLLTASTVYASDAQRMANIINDTFRTLKTDSQVDQFMLYAIGEAAKAMPVQLDEITIADAMIYNKFDNQVMYTMTILSDDVPDSTIEYIRDQGTAMACSTPNARAMLDNNISMRYTYYDINKEFVDDFVLNRRSCDKRS